MGVGDGVALRNGHLVGAAGGRAAPLPAAARPDFEEGLALIFSRWTALQLAVENGWGGSRSAERAAELAADAAGWFYSSADHEPSDLEALLDEALQVEFNVLAEDDSPYQVARSAVALHAQLAAGGRGLLDALRAAAPAPAARASVRAAPPPGQPQGSGEEGSSSSSGSGSGSEAEAESGGGGGGEAMDVDEAPRGPVVDEDGFQVVQRRGGRGRR